MIYRLPALLLSLLLLLLCSCTVSELPGLGSDAKTREGQMVYTTSRRSVVGDVILRTRSNGDYDLAFSKGGVSVLQLQSHGNELVATGLFARTGWKGPVDRAIGPLHSWALLKQVIPYFYSNQSSARNGRKWSASFTRINGKLTGTKIDFARHESMIFSFAQ
jgi:hypothetical protein